MHESTAYALDRYRALGVLRGRPAPNLTIGYTASFAAPSVRGDRPPSYFYGHTSSVFADNRCFVLLYEPVTSTFSPDWLPFMIAHEVFHCVQRAAYPQEYNPSAYWWQEGSAEFGANLVHPTLNHEFNHTYGYQHRRVLFDQGAGYPTEIFFQSFTTGYGVDAFSDLLAQMPDTTDPSAQYSILASIPVFREAFHDFGEQYVDMNVKDTGGGNVSQAGPEAEARLAVTGDLNTEVTSAAFVVTLYEFQLEPEKRYRLRVNLEDPLQVSYKLAGVSDWTRAASGTEFEIDQSCSSPQSLQMVVTAVSDLPDLFSAQVSFEEEACQQCPNGMSRRPPSCLIGTWTVPRSVVSHSAKLDPGLPGLSQQLDAFDYTLTIRADGTYDEVLGFAHRASVPSVMRQGEQMQMSQQVSGTSSGMVCTSERQVQFVGRQQMTRTQTMGDRSNTRRLGPAESQNTLEYYCGEGASDVEPPLPYPVNIDYLKLVGAAPTSED